MKYTIDVSLPDNVYCHKCPFLLWISKEAKGMCQEFRIVMLHGSDAAYCKIKGNKLRLCAYGQVLRSDNCPLKLVGEE
jgi:hypothetical protein